MKRTILAAVLLAGAALTTPASADTVVNGFFTSDHCDGAQGCTGTGQPGGFGTIQITDNDLGVMGGTGTLTFQIDLLNGNKFVNGHDASFAYNLIGNFPVTYSGLSDGFSIVGGTNPQTAGNLDMNGNGEFEYGVIKTAPGSSGPALTSLTFSISAINLGLEDLVELSTTPPGDTPAYMVVDLYSPNANGQTGVVDLSVFPTTNQQCTNCAVPGPIAGAGIPGLISACFGMFGLRTWRRRRKNLGLA